MTTFDKREQGFEAKLAHDEELHFRAVARRDKQFGLWIAGKLGKTGADAEAYAQSLVKTEVAEGAARALEAVKQDLATAGVSLSDHQIESKLSELLVVAKADLARA